MQVYNVKKLYFQANLCKVFAEDKSSTIVACYSLRMGTFAKLPSRFQSKCGRSIDLAMYWPITQSLAELLFYTQNLFFCETFWSFVLQLY